MIPDHRKLLPPDFFAESVLGTSQIGWHAQGLPFAFGRQRGAFWGCKQQLAKLGVSQPWGRPVLCLEISSIVSREKSKWSLQGESTKQPVCEKVFGLSHAQALAHCCWQPVQSRYPSKNMAKKVPTVYFNPEESSDDLARAWMLLYVKECSSNNYNYRHFANALYE